MISWKLKKKLSFFHSLLSLSHTLSLSLLFRKKIGLDLAHAHSFEKPTDDISQQKSFLKMPHKPDRFAKGYNYCFHSKQHIFEEKTELDFESFLLTYNFHKKLFFYMNGDI